MIGLGCKCRWMLGFRAMLKIGDVAHYWRFLVFDCPILSRGDRLLSQEIENAGGERKSRLECL
jgi:hypothetical protein